MFSCLPANDGVILGISESPSHPPQFDESACVDLELHAQLSGQILDEVSGVDWEVLLPLKGEYLGIPLQVVLQGKVCQGLAGEGDLGLVEGDESVVAHGDVGFRGSEGRGSGGGGQTPPAWQRMQSRG